MFDNVENIRDLKTYLPTETKSPGSVIVTTQRPKSRQITKEFYNIELQNFNEELDAKLLFMHLERDPADETERALVRETSAIVENLPLIIAIIEKYINESESSVEEFLHIMNVFLNA